MLNLDAVSVTIDDQEIVKGVSVEVPAGEVHYLMGPNGSGKSSLALGLMGFPGYELSGSATLDSVSLFDLPVHKRAQAGIFLSMQHPPAVKGVTVMTLLKNAYKALGGTESLLAFQKLVHAEVDALGISRDFLRRHVHDGFSGGEKKRLELLQLAVLRPKLAILDEPDSGLDVDGIKLLASQMNRLREDGMTFVIITHYASLLAEFPPDRVHVLKSGTLVASGDQSLAEHIQANGFETL